MFSSGCKRRTSINRPPTPDPDTEEDQDQNQQPTLQEIINIKVFFLLHLNKFTLLVLLV